MKFEVFCQIIVLQLKITVRKNQKSYESFYLRPFRTKRIAG